jgi:hypothetical protein
MFNAISAERSARYTCPRGTITEKEQKEACGCVVQNLAVSLEYEFSAT